VKKYKSLIQEDLTLIKEMANITPKYSGLEKGVIQIKPELRHVLLPHIHFVWNVKKSEDEFIKIRLASKEDNMIIMESKNINLNSKQLQKIKKFIMLNYKLLVKYYLQAEFLDTGDFVIMIKKI
jgi:hypothetical protein